MLGSMLVLRAYAMWTRLQAIMQSCICVRRAMSREVGGSSHELRQEVRVGGVPYGVRSYALLGPLLVPAGRRNLILKYEFSVIISGGGNSADAVESTAQVKGILLQFY